MIWPMSLILIIYNFNLYQFYNSTSFACAISFIYKSLLLQELIIAFLELFHGFIKALA